MIQTYRIAREIDKCHALLLEDDPGLAEALTEFLTTWRCEVTTVLNGAEGVQQVLAMDFDYIICDMVMPGFPGDMFYVAVKRVKPHLCPRFIFMTGHQADPKIGDFIREIRGILLWKPFAMNDLLTAMKTIQRRSGWHLTSPGIPPPALK